jgi:hypothetical protein
VNPIEDRLRDAFRADAETITPETIAPQVAAPPPHRARSADRPADRSGHPAFRRRRRLLASVAAAAAVAAIAVTATIAATSGPPAHDQPAASGSQPVHGQAATRPAPPFLVVTTSGSAGNHELGVFNAVTGQRTAVVQPKKGFSFAGTAATGASNSFIVAQSPLKGGCYTLFYRLTLNSRGELAGMTPMAVPRVNGDLSLSMSGLAASANGQVIGYAANACGSGHGWVSVIHERSGRTRVWSLTTRGLVSDLSMSASGSLLAFDNARYYGGDGLILALRTDSPAGPMEQHARIVLPTRSDVSAVGSIALINGGRTLLACREVHHDAILTSYDAATGAKIARLHTWSHVDQAPCLIAVTPSGGDVLVFDIATHGIGSRLHLATGQERLVPNSPKGGTNDPVGIAW